eukprot:4809699-Amphidinium_carterae.1
MESEDYHHHELMLWPENKYGQGMLHRLCETTAQHRCNLEDEARRFQLHLQNNAEQVVQQARSDLQDPRGRWSVCGLAQEEEKARLTAQLALELSWFTLVLRSADAQWKPSAIVNSLQWFGSSSRPSPENGNGDAIGSENDGVRGCGKGSNATSIRTRMGTRKNVLGNSRPVSKMVGGGPLIPENFKTAA